MGKARRYPTIKSLVFDYVHRTAGQVEPKALAAKVLEHFPSSRWKNTHWSWYKHQILKGDYRDEFNEAERTNLSGAASRARAAGQAPRRPQPGLGAACRGPAARDLDVKRVGDAVLDHVRFVLDLAARGDQSLRFKLNRWVFARLLQDEIRVKRPVKERLWDTGIRACASCGARFSSLSGIELHRKDPAIGYSPQNCELVCRKCHQAMA